MEKILFWKGTFFLGMLIAILISFIFGYSSIGGPFAVVFGIAYVLGAFISDFSLSKRWRRRVNVVGALVALLVIGIYFPSVFEFFFGHLSDLVVTGIAIFGIIILVIFVNLPFVEKWAKRTEKKIRENDMMRGKI
jgi:uncharacterized phage infection (PIP) family protein YhgE